MKKFLVGISTVKYKTFLPLLLVSSLIVFGCNISGTVTKDGSGLPDVQVVLSGGDASKTTTTGVDGSYSFGFLSPGLYTVTVDVEMELCKVIPGLSQQVDKEELFTNVEDVNFQVTTCFSSSINLCEKNGAPDWECVEGAGPGTLRYNETGDGEFEFDFTAENLNHEIEYTLAYIPDPWPQIGLICLASGTPESDGSLYLEGAPNIGDLPKYYDENIEAKIWLVPSALIDCGDYTADPIVPGKMIGWCAPEAPCDQILFEDALITFDDSEDENLPPELSSSADLCEKDSLWECIEESGAGAGTLQYNETGFGVFEFSFDAVELELETGYTLAYIPDPWTQDGIICLANGTSESDGSLHLEGTPVTGDLPKDYDANYPTGAKIWLVPSGYIDCDTQEKLVWCSPGDDSCTQNLYEVDLIKFDDFLD